MTLQATRCSQDEWPTAQSHQPLQRETRVPSAADGVSPWPPRPIDCCSSQNFRRTNWGSFRSLRYQNWRHAGATGARSEMVMTTTGPCIQVGTVFPRSRVGPAAFDRRRISCSATPPGVEPQGGHATDQTSHGCMMKPIGAASSAACQPKQRIGMASTLHMNE